MSGWEPPKTLSKFLLLVEGRDEEIFFGEFCKHLQLAEMQILGLGKTTFKERLGFLIGRHTDYEKVSAIGIIRDADDSRSSAFKSVCTALKDLGLPIPTDVFVPTAANPRISVLIMPPDNEGTGRMLEDLCLKSVETDPAMPCIADFFDCLKQQEIVFRENVIAKAQLHAFLASRPDPDAGSVGVAAQKRYWNFDSPVFEKVKAFLQQIASQEG